ncbi:hypothetical protein J7E93_15815 [Streptomyces sp. ISL-36]|uniref:hypothetical protein n=1 Tax=Streptomyces sp. ISL-36 TaxID=2819182 RepID=UPI001BE8EB97|nr:hypothetical protein [Streptomyces sp. ISL-36]MBT2441555.1 hypothetical protein [Streptomyces sp. ISL-36]
MTKWSALTASPRCSANITTFRSVVADGSLSRGTASVNSIRATDDPATPSSSVPRLSSGRPRVTATTVAVTAAQPARAVRMRFTVSS